jgi:hypothetical protein
VVGNLLVFATMKAIKRAIARHPDLGQRRERVMEINRRDLRLQAAESEARTARREQGQVQERRRKTAEAATNRVSLDEPPSTKVAYTLLAAVLGEGEAMLFVLLSAPSQMFGLPAWFWALVAPAAAATAILALHVTLGNFLTTKHRPATTIRRAKIGATVFGALVILAAWGVLSGRNITDAALVSTVVGVSMVALATLLSVSAAMCLLVAVTMWEGEHEEIALAHLETLDQEYGRHVELVEAEIAKLLPGAPGAGASQSVTHTDGTGANGNRLTQVFPVVGLLLALSVNSMAQAQRPSRSEFARDGVCEILIDGTSSTSKVKMKEAVELLGAHMPRVLEALACETVRVVRFTGTMFDGMREFRVARVTEVRCSDADSASNAERAIRLMYPQQLEASRRVADSACARRMREVGERALAQRSHVADSAVEALRHAATAPTRGACTALWHAVDRSIRRAQSVTVLTDAVSTCAPPRSLATIPDLTTLLFLLLPTDGDAHRETASAIEDRMRAIEARYPVAQVYLAGEATGQFWRSFGRGQ